MISKSVKTLEHEGETHICPVHDEPMRCYRYRSKQHWLCLKCKSAYNKKHREELRYSNDPIVVLKYLFEGKKKHAKGSGDIFTLTFEHTLEVFEFYNRGCAYTGKPFDFSAKDLSKMLSFDQMCPGKGYVNGNVILCSVKANIAKTDYSPAELKRFQRRTYEVMARHKEQFCRTQPRPIEQLKIPFQYSMVQCATTANQTTAYASP